MMAHNSTDRIELLLDRLGTMTRTFTEASERSTRRLDVQIKTYVDRGAQATDQALRVIDRELQRQIAAMKRELPRLERAAERIREASPTPTKLTVSDRPTVKKAPPKKVPPTKATARRAPSTKAKATATRAPATKAATRKAAARAAKKGSTPAARVA